MAGDSGGSDRGGGGGEAWWPLVAVGRPGRGPDRVRVAAIAGPVVALATEETSYVAEVGSDAEPRELGALDWPPHQLAVAPSGRWALVTSRLQRQADVVDLRTGGHILALGDIGGRPLQAVAAFAVLDGDEVLLASHDRYAIEVRVLPTGELMRRVDYDRIMFDHFHPLPDGDTLVAIGHEDGGSKDDLVTLSLRGLIDDDFDAEADWRERWARPCDYAYRVAVGPCGRDEIVLYRDPEDDEVPEPGEEPDTDIDDLHGLYFRRLADGALGQRIEIDRPVPSSTPLFATGSAVVLSQPGEVLLIPRTATGDGQQTPVAVAAPVHAFDPANRRILTVGADGTIAVHEVGG